MLTVILGIGLSVLDSSMLMLALPEIVRDLGVGARDGVTVVYAYQIAVLALLLPLSLAGDLFGYRRVYLAGAMLFAVAATASFLSHGLVQLAAARALQGVAAAGLMAVNAALIRLIYPREALGAGIAINSAVVAGSAVAGPALASALLTLADWHWLFVPGIAVAVLVAALGWHSLPANHAPPPRGARLPWLDIALNAATFLLVFVGAQGLAPRGGAAGSAPGGLAGPMLAGALLAAGLGVGLVYLRRQRGRVVPLLPVDLLAIPVFRLSVLTSVMAFSAQTLAAIALPFLLLERLQRGPAEAGWILAAWPLCTVGVAPLAARLIGRVPGGLLGGIGLTLLATGFVSLAAAPWAATPTSFALGLALCGLGWGLFQSPNNHTIVTAAPLHRAGGAAGMQSTARLAGQATGSALIGGLYGLAGPAGSGGVPALALGVAAGCALAAAATSLLRLRV